MTSEDNIAVTASENSAEPPTETPTASPVVSPTPAPNASRVLTDSPWFWAHLFCVAGMIALFVMQPKYGARQAQLERQFQGRQHALQRPHGEESALGYSNEKSTLITLNPLFWLLATGVVGTWGGLWWTHFRPRWSTVAVATPPRT